MPKQLLVDSIGEFAIDRTRLVAESTPSGSKKYTYPGILSLCDTTNGNKRRYSRPVWEKNLQTGSVLQDAISRNAAFGLLEHPKDGLVDLQSPIAIITSKAALTEKGEVTGEITILGTPEGQRLVALIEGGWNPTVSSRGFGSLVRNSEGIDDVQSDYVCEGWDVVLKPSFTPAVIKAQPEPQASFAESKPASPTTLKESLPSTSIDASSIKPQKQIKVMSESIRQRVSALRAVECSKLDPARFAQGLAEMSSLHQEVAGYLAEDAKRSWEAQQLHLDISSLEESWTKAAKAPAVQATKLSEDKTKLLQVTAAVVTAADALRTQLGESIKNHASAKSLVSEAVKRGKVWRERAEQLESKLATLEEKYDVATEALDKIADRYKGDVTAMGRRLITLEFQEKAATPEIKKALAEAKIPADILAIRESLTVKPEAKPATPEVKPTMESKAPEVKPEIKPTVEAKIEIISRSETGPQSISESVAVAQRLSQRVQTAA